MATLRLRILVGRLKNSQAGYEQMVKNASGMSIVFVFYISVNGAYNR